MNEGEIRPGSRLAAGCGAALFLLAGAADAQRLWNVEEVAARSAPPVVMDGTAVSAAAAGASTVGAAVVQVEFDYLRLGMGYLELPLPDGSIIAAENAVFEDRGGGDLMWTGEVPGAGYESVLFTVQDGHLVGWFGAPGGPKYVVYAGPDGRGSLAEEVGPSGDWCGVGSSGGDMQSARSPVSLGSGEVGTASVSPVSAASGGGRLDILVLYTTGMELAWRSIGGPAVGVQRLSDYVNMVFRNGALPATVNLIPEQWDPQVANRPLTHQGGHYWSWRKRLWVSEYAVSPDVFRLRQRHAPDLIYFILSGDVVLGGAAEQRVDLEPRVLRGFTTPENWTFAHEIGHNLGGHHDPPFFPDFPAAQAGMLRPYAFGHTDMTSCARREGGGNSLFCPVTVMSYGLDARRDGDPRTRGSAEPFYSSVRHRPNGWTIGVAGEREVERVLRETLPVAVRSGEAAARSPRGSLDNPGNFEFDVRWVGRDTVRLASLSGGFDGTVRFGLAEGANDQYGLSKTSLSKNVTEVGSGVYDIAGLRPGGRYAVAAQVRLRKGGRREVSDRIDLAPPSRPSGAPMPASDLSARETGPGSLRLSWRDNSSAESGYEVWYRKWSSDEPDEVWRRHGDPLPAGTTSASIGGLAAEDERARTYRGDLLEYARIGRYSFVVVAYNGEGFGASETLDVEFLPGPWPQPTAPGEITNCVPGWAYTGLSLDGYEVNACLETPDGARRRVWDYRLGADRSGLLYFFDRDNVEILVKVLDGCAINGHRWVFVAPVTTLSFKLQIWTHNGPDFWSSGDGALDNAFDTWYYDSARRPQEELLPWDSGNPTDRTARTVSDTTAFPCTAAEVAAAMAASPGAGADSGRSESGGRALLTPAPAASPTSLAAGADVDCVPTGAAVTLRGGYKVSMCYETYRGETGDARDWGLDSSQSALLYFFERDNAEVLIKVLDGCGVNGHRWVFVAPVTDLAFNLVVESPSGERWTHANRLGRTADAASDVTAFPCSA